MPDKSRIFFYSLLAFCGGIFFGSFFDIPNSIILTAALVCVALIAIFFRKGSRLVNFKITLTSFLVIFFLLGIARYNVIHSRQQNLPKLAEAAKGLVDPAHRHPIKVALYGYINAEPVVNSDKQQFVFFAKEMDALSRRIKVMAKLNSRRILKILTPLEASPRTPLKTSLLTGRGARLRPSWGGLSLTGLTINLI